MLPFADEEVYSAEFVYESIYEEIPAEVSEVKVKPFPAPAPLTRTPQTTRTSWEVTKNHQRLEQQFFSSSDFHINRELLDLRLFSPKEFYFNLI